MSFRCFLEVLTDVGLMSNYEEIHSRLILHIVAIVVLD